MSEELIWHDIRELTMEGQGWTDTKAPYDRLPARAEGVVRGAVWDLSRHSAGISARFISDADRIAARWTLTSDGMPLAHMAATGVKGLDLYGRVDGAWKWAGVGRPTDSSTNEADLVAGMAAIERDYRLYLPLYNGVSQVEIGVPSGFRVQAAQADERPPLLFYGTSITHGASASRCGTCHVAVIGRHFDRPTLNLGFAGNGKMEPEVAVLVAEQDPAVFVIDCLPNMVAEEVSERAPGLVQTIRSAHHDTPIVLVADRTYSDAAFVSDHKERNQTSRMALRAVDDSLIAAGTVDLYYMEGEQLLEGDDTVDGSHPTDLGFARHASAFIRELTPLL